MTPSAPAFGEAGWGPPIQFLYFVNTILALGR